MTGTDLAPMLIKMAVVAAVVVLASMAAERSRPLIGALIATLPISLGPTYILLAMQHETAFVSAAALKSVAGTAAILAFIVVYARAALCWPLLPAVLAGYAVWAVAAWLVHVVDWSVPGAVALVLVAVALAHGLTADFRRFRPPASVRGRWWDAPLRAASVVLLVGSLTGLSTLLGASGVGALANFPIVMSSVGVIMNLRFGAQTAAAVMANAVFGMAGVAVALLAVHATIVPFGAVWSLVLGLLICVAWNAGLFALSRR